MDLPSERIARLRAFWRYVGDERPPFAVVPQPGQESVWDYPRPPRLEPDTRDLSVSLGATEIARTRRALRLLETASAPNFYLPRQDVRMELLAPCDRVSVCEWKGEVRYWSVTVEGRRLEAAAWEYPRPLPGYEALRDHMAFYPRLLDCRVDGVHVQPQPGGFYGGWITPEVVGPFKGGRGSEDW
ncbi:MAG: hypothetical protein JWQ03_2259 [Variovorax sp.]|nr:hypothetical protein [Variovorax sp.]